MSEQCSDKKIRPNIEMSLFCKVFYSIQTVPVYNIIKGTNNKK